MSNFTNESPCNVGILAMEMYFPSRFVSQEDLEVNDNCKGKYTIGLGQTNMAFTDDREDINSGFLSVTSQLFEKYNIDPKDIGRLEIGTETLIDKSKSSKTVLMRLFGDNTDVEGVTSINACYGGTAALFNSISWVQSQDWDGRYALVVCGDIAVYEAGPARPTGGYGTIAMLIGPDAPLVFESKLRSSHNLDVYDFYKPYHSEYAAVDGKLSQWAYLSSVDRCYLNYKLKYKKHYSSQSSQSAVTTDHFDYFAFHSPYNKLVQKGFTRLIYMDFLNNPEDSRYASLTPYRGMNILETYESKDVDTACRAICNEMYVTNVLMPACTVNQNIGNCYTGSVFASLLSVVCKAGSDLVNKRVFMFSYGSGSVASIYSFKGQMPESQTKFTLAMIQLKTNIFERLQARKKCSPNEFISALDMRAKNYGKNNFIPEGSIDHISPGAYYLKEINSKYHREYARK